MHLKTSLGWPISCTCDCDGIDYNDSHGRFLRDGLEIYHHPGGQDC